MSLHNYTLIKKHIKKLKKRAKDAYSIKNKKLNKLEVLFDLNSIRSAGMFKGNSQNAIIRLNKRLIDEVGENKYLNTITHEYAHFIAFLLYQEKGLKIRAHGKEWASIMKNLDSKSDIATTNSSLRNGMIKAYKSRFKTVSCKCKEYTVSNQRANNIINKKMICAYCKKEFKL